LDNAKRIDIPVYVATNLVESMVKNPEPNRAEINDIVKTLESGAEGLVLAAESAIGLYPSECVRVLSRLIKEIDRKPKKIELDYLLNTTIVDIIKPHGGKIVQQFISENEKINNNSLPTLIVDQKIESDVIQIANGTYSPINRFMNYNELQLVLRKNELRDGIIWTMPILLQINEDDRKYCINNGELGLKSERTGQLFAIIKVEKIEELKQLNKIAKQWFGTNDEKHPGVKHFMKSGNYILSGKPFLIKGYNPLSVPNYDISPSQTRNLFGLYGWSDIIGYHTRNIPHRGHEYIQKKALEETNADGIFVSPVTGEKKKGDFTAFTLIHCYEKLVKEGFYNPFGVIIGPFNTYSRYCGPREAVFTALCRKNYGCNHFIVGRDHTGVGNYHSCFIISRNRF
jgi:ATP sulfurylase